MMGLSEFEYDSVCFKNEPIHAHLFRRYTVIHVHICLTFVTEEWDVTWGVSQESQSTCFGSLFVLGWLLSTVGSYGSVWVPCIYTSGYTPSLTTEHNLSSYTSILKIYTKNW